MNKFKVDMRILFTISVVMCFFAIYAFYVLEQLGGEGYDQLV